MFLRIKYFLYWICSKMVLDVSYDPDDPMSIIRAEDNEGTTEYVERYYGASELFHILKTGFTVVCVCAVLVSLIMLLYVKKAEMVADKKADIMHKLGIVFLISSFGSILSIILQFVQAVF